MRQSTQGRFREIDTVQKSHLAMTYKKLQINACGASFVFNSAHQ